MELKTKYQYTYFIYPFAIKESKYTRYLLKLLKDENCKLRIFRKDKDLDIYSYFSHRARNYMFSTFNWNKTKLARLDELPLDTKAAILAKNPCTIFEYTIKKDIQGKTEERNGIFFKIPKIEIICFNTGICFLCIKTNIEESDKFADLLNFNYKFRDINKEFANLDNYDNIRVQTDCFADVKIFKEFIGILRFNYFSQTTLLQFPSPPLNAFPSLKSDHEPQRTFDNTPDTKELDACIHTCQHSDRRHANATANESGFQHLPQESTATVQDNADKGLTHATIDQLYDSQGDQNNTGSDKRQGIQKSTQNSPQHSILDTYDSQYKR